jgi:hypothetical protein
VRATHSYSYALARALMRLGYTRGNSTQESGIYGRVDFQRIPGLRRIWPWIELLSLMPVMVTRVTVPSLLGRVVVCDRCTIDTVPTIAYMLSDEGFERSLVARLLISMVSRRSVLINLDCDYDSIVRRRGSVSEPREFISIQRMIYARLAKELHATQIDTSVSDQAKTQDLVNDLVDALVEAKTLDRS